MTAIMTIMPIMTVTTIVPIIALTVTGTTALADDEKQDDKENKRDNDSSYVPANSVQGLKFSGPSVKIVRRNEPK